MSDSAETGTSVDNQQQRLTALFAQLVMQQSNMAMLLLGKVPHPESGQVVKDLDAARLFIDELEMLDVKTRGNLTKEEAGLLKQTLMGLRLAFVEAVEPPGATSGTPSTPEAGEHGSQAASPGSGEAGSEPEESRKKFSKKY